LSVQVTEGSEQIQFREAGSVRLEPGAHDSPDDGVCVVELASMLAGEEFSDHPRCVCNVIGGFLPRWDGRGRYTHPQRLYPYASLVVGTGGGAAATRRRRDLCLEWGTGRRHDSRRRKTLERLRMRVRIAWLIGMGPAIDLDEGAGAYAARTCFKRGGVDEA